MDVYSYDNVSGNILRTLNYTIQVGGEVVSNGATIQELEDRNGCGIATYKNGVRVHPSSLVLVSGSLKDSNNTTYSTTDLGINTLSSRGEIIAKTNNFSYWTQPSSYLGNPRSDSTIADVSSTKDRPAQFAGMANPVVIGGTSRFGGNLQWGTGSVADGNYAGSATDTAYISTPTNVESSASAWLKFKDNVDGTQEYAMGRVVKYTDGRLRFQQKLDDALVSGCPRIQWFTSPLINKLGRYQIPMIVQFGDATTPYPTYVLNKDAVLFAQVKGSASQPVIAAVVQYDNPALDTLKVNFNMKNSNTGSVTIIASAAGLAKNTPYNFVIEGVLDFGSGGYWGIWKDGSLLGEFNGNTLMADFADNVQLMLGIYRYQYTVKAPDDCAIIFHSAGIKLGLK